MKSEGWKRGLLTAVMASAAVVLVCALVSYWRFGLAYSARAMLSDGVLLLPATWLLVRGAAWRGAPWAFAACVGFLFILGHAIKVSFLGIPITVGDAGPLVQLFRVLHGWRLGLAVFGLLVVCALLLASLWPRRGGLRYVLLLLAYLVLLPPMVLAISPWHQAEDANQLQALRREGGLLFLLMERGHATFEKAGPDQRAVRSALASAPAAGAPKPASRRNVHVILMESMWDPMQLGAYKFSKDPWDPRMRALWQAGGSSTVLSPVFGGATANAEFEVLCGLPATPGRVVFESAMNNPLPCLPALLRRQGYLTTANHPYKAKFWSRDKAYARLGFQQYNPLSAYRLDDVDGMFLNDRSAFFQLLDRLNGMPVDQPYLAYVVSLSSHYPYDRDRAKRPDRVQVTPENRLLRDYVNSIAYSTEALMDYVASVRELDPDALIVVFGDHAPMLGNDPDPYRQSGLRSLEEEGNAGAVTLSSTPLIVIDGKRGAVDVGHKPLYALPALILEMLGGDNLPYAQLIAGNAAHTRVFLGALLASDGQGWVDCGQSAAACADGIEERNRLDILRDDLVVGRQYSLEMLGSAPQDRGWNMQINEQYDACKLSVENWGPRFAAEGEGFNVQRDGSNAFWFKIREARGDLLLRVGDDDQTTVTVNARSASASFRDPTFLREHGEYPVSVLCGDSSPQLIGTFKVTKSAK